MKKLVSGGLLTALLLTGATAVQAQISFGPKVGLNLANIKWDQKEGDAPDTKMLLGPQFGLTLSARFGNLSIQPAIMYSQKGCKIDDTVESTVTSGGDGTSVTTTNKGTAKGSISLGYLEIPVNVAYTVGGDKGFQVFAGPYIGIGIGGKDKMDAYKAESTTVTKVNGQIVNTVTTSAEIASVSMDAAFKSDVKDSDDQNKSYYNTPDFGLNFGVGYLINNIQIQAAYGWGFSNLIPKYAGKSPDDKAYNRVIQVTASYMFNAN